MLMKPVLILAMLCACALYSEGVYAAPKLATVSEQEDGYGYTFKDDVLDGLPRGYNHLTIRTRARAPRGMLLRPRLHFVPQLRRSVEAL